jgi:O-antigen/teichoic acid export membrane protein
VDLNAYDLVLKCFFGIEFLQNSLSAVIFPKLYEIWTKNKENSTTKESNRYFNVFTAINILQIILFCLCIPLMYHWLLDKPGFYRAEMYIGLLASGYALRSILNFYISTILFSKKINVLLKISVVSAVFQIVVVFIASKYYGLMGAIYAGLATKVVQVIFSIVFSKGTFNYQFNYFKIIVVPFILIAVNLVQFLFFPVYNWLFYAGQFALFSLIFFFLFRNEITAVYLQFLGKKSGKV